jgi:murein DD-endopeptidase MepM/ murein hydrolase activator NlpD
LTDLQAQTAAGAISTYVVEEGDTVSSIAATYGISANTIYWANNLNRKSRLKIGQTLVILPITSVQHKVVKGDTIAKIAKRYNGNADEIIAYNGLEDGALTVGDTIIIPDGEMPAAPLPPKVASRVNFSRDGGPDLAGYYLRPVLGCIKTQGIHGHNAVDLGCPVGTPLRAAAPGTVIIASVGGWGGGYGNYIVIRHPNGTQTVYGHLSRVGVSVGQTVDRGEAIGATGNTGKSTGPHLHFEVRGARNPF